MWDVTRRVLASLRDRHLGLRMMGSGGCGGPICRRVLAVRLTAGIRTRNGLASSIVPAGTSLHRSAEFRFSPVVFLLCTTRCEIPGLYGRSFFSGPTKLGAIHPHAMHDDRQPSRHSDDRALHPTMPVFAR